MSPEKFDRRSQLAAARATLAASGKSPRELGREKMQTILNWLYRWGVSSTAILSILLQKNAGAIVNRLANHGFINQTKTKSGSPASFLTLSQVGLEEATRQAEKLLPYLEIDPFRVNQNLLRHNLLTQQLTCSAWMNYEITGFQTEKEISLEGDHRNTKRPDAIWSMIDGPVTAIEVELSPKWERDLDQFVLGVVLALMQTEKQPRRFDKFIVFSDSLAILTRYQTAMSPGAPLKTWKKNTRGYWFVDETLSVPKWLLERVEFRAIED